MSKEFELKPCPFCGGGASIEVAWAPDTDGGEMECRLIICHGCNAQMQDEVENLAELVRKWNTRHDLTAGRALGRREVKGEAADVAWDMLVDGVSWGHDGNCGSPEIVKCAIEAIPEEV